MSVIITITLFVTGDGPVADILWPVHQQLGFLLFLLAFARGGWGIMNIATPTQTWSGGKADNCRAPVSLCVDARCSGLGALARIRR
ncbi:cytochrome b561 [Ochrobactrum daejeonense]|uniref:Cytochrome b561 n=1 Tax=Brucella daejeonensis TaxID=659015 RepID=A0A7W9AXJ0_9HYPH|nr:hypothetical protein [Brucella daejeonensis]MBB5702232.1 cytochrome b561 [Brucella daejeonensis]